MKPRIRIKQVWWYGHDWWVAYDSNPHVDRLTGWCSTPERAYTTFTRIYGEY